MYYCKFIYYFCAAGKILSHLPKKVISAAVKVVYYRNHEYCQIYYKNEAINNYHQVTNNHLPTLIPSPFHMPITI